MPYDGFFASEGGTAWPNWGGTAWASLDTTWTLPAGCHNIVAD